MGIEIERKFLLATDAWRDEVERSVEIRQGYVPAPEATIRVRLVGDRAVLTFKTATSSITRGEWDIECDPADGRELIAEFCPDSQMRKTRHFVHVGEHEWVIDEFYDANAGLIVAELELDDEDEAFERPAWLGDEVSHDERYFNALLVKRPYSTW